MDKISFQNYQVEDFIADESFVNYHFQSNKNDQLFWNEWLLKHPGKQALAKEAREMLETLSLNITEKEYQEELKKITAAISNKRNLRPVFQLPGRNISQAYHRKKRTMQYLLPLLLILISGGYWLLHSLPNRSPGLAETFNNGNLPLILTLSDGTVVSLGSHSYLRYPLRFEDKERNVYLQGNAQFTVKRNEQHPFKVHDENIVATVLGTIFNIKSAGDSAIEVELLQGKLKVEVTNPAMGTGRAVLLIPNERAVYVRNDNHLYKNLVIPATHVYFRQNDFAEIASQLKSVFGVTLINESNKKAWRFTGTFETSTAKDIVENICLVKKLSFVVTGDTIVIK